MQQQSLGFTLLEILIVLVIFSVSLLGLAGLQLTGLQLSHDALLRATATMMAKDMADRIRANPQQADLGVAGNYHNPAGTAVGNPACLGKDGSGNSADTSCAPSAMALHDFYEWNAMLGGQAASGWHPAIPSALPSGHGIVCVDSTPNDGTPGAPMCDNIAPIADRNVYTIKIWWREGKDKANPVARQFVMSVAI